MMLRWLLLVVSSTAMLLICSREAAAQGGVASTAEQQVYYEATFEPDDGALAKRLRRHLSAALAARGLHLSVQQSATQPLAGIFIRYTATNIAAVQAAIEVRDALTQKRVERTMDLTAIPSDSRMLAIASSADELLRASWAELAMIDAPKPVSVPPASVLQSVEKSFEKKPVERRTEVVPELGGSLFWRRAALLGKVRFLHWFTPRWALLVAPAFGLGLRQRATHGSLRTDTLELEAGAAYAVIPNTAPWGLDIALSTSMLRVSYTARANDLGEANSFSDWALGSALGVRGFWGRGTLRLSAAAAATYVLRPSRATDEGKTVSAVHGVGAQLSLGVGAFF